VIVNFRSDPDLAIRGVLWAYRGSWLVLRDAALLKANASATPLDGDAIVHRDNVSFLQVLP
jgi:hypothetical protein